MVNHRVYYLDVAPCGNLWHDATIHLMDIDLRINNITQQPAAIFNNSGGRFVTTAFDSQNSHLLYFTMTDTDHVGMKRSGFSPTSSLAVLPVLAIYC